MTVLNFKNAAFFKSVDRRLGRVRLDIDYAGVTRIRSAANLSPDDAVVLRANAKSQFDALMQSCALDGNPATWSQFRGNHIYCERLHVLAAGVHIAPMGTVQQSCAVYESQYPGVSVPLALFVQGQLVELGRWHQANHVFERNAREYDGAYDQEETLTEGD